MCVAAALSSALVFLIACASDTNQCSPVGRVFGSMSGEPVIPRSANRILVPEFEDRSNVLSLSSRVTYRVREEIVRDGRLGVVEDRALADIVLEGRIASCQVQPLDYNGAGMPVKKRMRVLASVRLLEISSGREIFSDRDIQAFEVYSEIVPPVMNEQVVQDRVITELSRRIAKQAATGWYTELMTREEKGKK